MPAIYRIGDVRERLVWRTRGRNGVGLRPSDDEHLQAGSRSQAQVVALILTRYGRQ